MKAPTNDAVQAWARGAVSAAPNATSAELRVAALRLVARTEFAPPLDDALAIGISLGRSRDPVGLFTSQVDVSREETDLGQAIDRLTRSFFHVPVEERRQRWTALYLRTAVYPWWRTRLDQMRAGLDVDLSQFPDADELFTLSVGERDKRLRSYSAKMRAKAAEVTTNVDVAQVKQEVAKVEKLKRQLAPPKAQPHKTRPRKSQWDKMKATWHDLSIWLKLFIVVLGFIAVVLGVKEQWERTDGKGFKARLAKPIPDR